MTNALDHLIRQAIREKRIVEFRLHGLQRIGEPHIYGVHNGIPQLLIYQTAGETKSSALPGWRRANLPEIVDLRILDRCFPVGQQAPTARHSGWDQILEEVG